MWSRLPSVWNDSTAFFRSCCNKREWWWCLFHVSFWLFKLHTLYRSPMRNLILDLLQRTPERNIDLVNINVNCNFPNFIGWKINPITSGNLHDLDLKKGLRFEPKQKIVRRAEIKTLKRCSPFLLQCSATYDKHLPLPLYYLIQFFLVKKSYQINRMIWVKVVSVHLTWSIISVWDKSWNWSFVHHVFDRIFMRVFFIQY